MNKLNDSQMRVFARAIMPELYLLQERWDKRREVPKRALYHLANPEDYEALVSRITG